MQAKYKHLTFEFRKPGGTSRGVLHTKESWFLVVSDESENITGIGECSLLPGLSPDDAGLIEKKLELLCAKIQNDELVDKTFFDKWPALEFAYEMAMKDVENGGRQVLFKNGFLDGAGIPINGLIWMGNKDFMLRQIKQKIDQNYRCLKLKIGAIDFKDELALIDSVRKEYSVDDIEIRVDANGAFPVDSALEYLKRLSDYELHSIEQPISAGKWEEMGKLISLSPLKVALDEELIGIPESSIQDLLSTINPDYVILKPSLLGGIMHSEQWILNASQLGIPWWVTSALESNIGLNAIAQWTFGLGNEMYQGLGTGQLYTNNIVSPLDIINAELVHTKYDWELDPILD